MKSFPQVEKAHEELLFCPQKIPFLSTRMFTKILKAGFFQAGFRISVDKFIVD